MHIPIVSKGLVELVEGLGRRRNEVVVGAAIVVYDLGAVRDVLRRPPDDRVRAHHEREGAIRVVGAMVRE
jgi:hypothetical protein